MYTLQVGALFVDRLRKLQTTCGYFVQILGTFGVFFSLSVKGAYSLMFVQVLFSDWIQFPFGKSETKLSRAAPLYLLWEIWKERNQIFFQDEVFSFNKLKSSFFFF